MDRVCEQYGDFLADYIAGELDWAARARLQAHLDRCPDCRTELAAMNEMFEFLRVGLSADDGVSSLDAARRQFLREFDAESRAENRIVSLAEARVAAAPAERHAARSNRWIAAAASFMLAACVGALALLRSPSAGPGETRVAAVRPPVQSSFADYAPVEFESLSTYGLVVPVVRDIDAERASLMRLSNAVYEYPPAYGLHLQSRTDPIDASNRYWGVDGPKPFVEFRDDGNLLAL